MVKMNGIFFLIVISMVLISCTHQQTKSSEGVTSEAEQETTESVNTAQNGNESDSGARTPDLSDANIEDVVNGESAALAALDERGTTNDPTQASLVDSEGAIIPMAIASTKQTSSKSRKGRTNNRTQRGSQKMSRVPEKTPLGSNPDLGSQPNTPLGEMTTQPGEAGEMKSPGNTPKTDPFGMGEDEDPRAAADGNKAHLASTEITQFIAHNRFVLVLIGFAILGVSWAAMRPRKKPLGGMLRPLDRD